MDRCSLPTPFGFVTKFGLCYPGAIRSRPYSSIFTLTSELIFRPRMCCWAWLLRQKKQTLRSCLLSFRTQYAKCSGGLDYWIASERIDCSRPLTTACKIISRDTRRLVALAFRWAYCNPDNWMITERATFNQQPHCNCGCVPCCIVIYCKLAPVLRRPVETTRQMRTSDSVAKVARRRSFIPRVGPHLS